MNELLRVEAQLSVSKSLRTAVLSALMNLCVAHAWKRSQKQATYCAIFQAIQTMDIPSIHILNKLCTILG